MVEPVQWARAEQYSHVCYTLWASGCEHSMQSWNIHTCTCTHARFTHTTQTDIECTQHAKHTCRDSERDTWMGAWPHAVHTNDINTLVHALTSFLQSWKSPSLSRGHRHGKAARIAIASTRCQTGNWQCVCHQPQEAHTYTCAHSNNHTHPHPPCTYTHTKSPLAAAAAYNYWCQKYSTTQNRH